MRKAKIERVTGETNINIDLNLDGSGISKIDSGSGFFNHMLELFTYQSKIDLSVLCKGDVDVDYHHSVEDIGISLGEAFKKALGEKKGIVRYGECLLPMDEALVSVALDFSGRSYLGYGVELRATKLSDDGKELPAKIGSFDAELIEEFLLAFTRTAGLTLHIKKLAGKNSHHIVEAVFKGLGRAVRQAISIDKDFAVEIPSTKGKL